MPREFVSFDDDAIEEELDALDKASSSDLAKLDFCMRRYEQVSPKENPSPALVESFDEGFLELRHIRGDYKGRLLFYVPKVPKGTEELVMLVVFRKQTQKTPQPVINLAEKRMKADVVKRYEKEKKK
jgi:phage-related protein